jgi:hypothetical protein
MNKDVWHCSPSPSFLLCGSFYQLFFPHSQFLEQVEANLYVIDAVLQACGLIAMSMLLMMLGPYV